MSTDWVRQAARRSRGVVAQAVTCVALVAGSSSPPFGEAAASAPLVPGLAQGQGDDPCRFVTDEAMGKAFGRAMKGARLTNVCDYRGPGTDRVVVKVATGPEGTILRQARSAAARAGTGVQKVATPVGEAYFDDALPVFVGRVGDREVQIEATIQPVPREAMIAVGGRIMEGLARK